MTRMPNWLIWLLLVSLPAWASGAPGDGDSPGDAGGNIGRTEADDDPDEAEYSRQLSKLGAVSIPLKINEDCQATIGLYTPQGQLVRILGQVLDLKKGEYTIRWDGLDLFGNLVPPTQELIVKTITNKPIRAYYEFSVAAPKVAPWPYGEGQGPDHREGGWLADHSAPGCATAVGDQVLLGSTLAEFGSNLIAVNLSGEKLWGTHLSGWAGPRILTSDGAHAYAVDRLRTTVWKLDPRYGAKGIVREKLWSSGRDKIQSIAAAGGKLYVVVRDFATDASPLRVALSNADIDFAASQPQVLNLEAPTEFTISPQQAFGNTFTSAGNPQNGASFVVREGEGYIIVAFKKPVEVGAFVLGAAGGAARIEAFALDPKLKYDEKKHSPIRKVGDDEANLSEFASDCWIKYGAQAAVSPLTILPAPRQPLKTMAVYVHVTPPPNLKGPFRPRIAGARLMNLRFERIAAPIRRTVVAQVDKEAPTDSPTGFSLRTRYPLSDVYPAHVVYELPKEESFDGLSLLNCVNHNMYIDALVGAASGEAAAAGADSWKHVGTYNGGWDKRQGSLAGSKHGNEKFVAFAERITTRAIRLRIVEGLRESKWHPRTRQGDPFLAECDDVALVKLLDWSPKPPPCILRIVDAADGKELGQSRHADLDLPVLTASPDGALYGVRGGRLCRVEFPASAASPPSLQPMSDVKFDEPLSIATSKDRIAVADGARRAIVVFDRSGKQLFVIGDKGDRRRGAWDPNVIERPAGVAIASDGSIWVAEERFAPKRVARFSADGKFIEEFLGPPMYGGGGHLDPNLKAFYDRGMEFELDWARGTSRLAALNDRLRSEETVVQSDNSFQYTTIGRPLYYKDRRYIVQGSTICLKEGDVWRPCMVMGSAWANHFLMGKPSWRKHWAQFDLRGKLFLWCDQNDDGKYQMDEVELFELPDAGRPFANLTVGPDLSLWGNAIRLKPHRFTPSGAPLYRVKDIQPFDYDKLAPHYPRNYTCAGSKSAKPHYFGFKYICQDGSMVQEGQPYIVRDDGTILGGEVRTRPSDYLPPIQGLVPNTTWSFPGGAMTKSQVGEIAIVNSMNGYWYVWAPQYGVCIGSFFTGQTGGWSYFKPRRGEDVSGRKHYWEGWHGDFVKGVDGNYYAQGGKGDHSIARIEGLDDYKLGAQPLKSTPEQHAANAALRPTLKARYDAARLASSKDGRKSIASPGLAQRARNFVFDGLIKDWGDRRDMHSIGPKADKLLFDVAHDDKGAYFVLYGESRLANSATDWKALPGGGFAIDIQWRTNSAARSPDAVAGDRRLVIARFQGKWTAAFYDYLVPGAPENEAMSFTSPVAVTRISRVSQLADGAWKLAMKEGTIEDLIDEGMGNLKGLGDLPPAPGEMPKDRPRDAGAESWSAEMFMPWSTLGIAPDKGAVSMRCDIGILRPGAKGTATARADYWSNTAPLATRDPAVAAMLNPGAWGYISFAIK